MVSTSKAAVCLALWATAATLVFELMLREPRKVAPRPLKVALDISKVVEARAGIVKLSGPSAVPGAPGVGVKVRVTLAAAAESVFWTATMLSQLLNPRKI